MCVRALPQNNNFNLRLRDHMDPMCHKKNPTILLDPYVHVLYKSMICIRMICLLIHCV